MIDTKILYGSMQFLMLTEENAHCTPYSFVLTRTPLTASASSEPSVLQMLLTFIRPHCKVHYR